MPLYQHQCKCGESRETCLPISEYDQPQVCDCGKVMQRVVSLASFVMKQYGSQMALDTLNSKQGMPNRWWRASAERVAARGL